jgi:hypothetical protein
MKYIILAFLLLFNLFSVGQTYSGSSQYFASSTIKIQKDSTVLFVNEGKSGGAFIYYSGGINKVNDTLFHISLTEVMAAVNNMALCTMSPDGKIDDTISLSIDTPFVKPTDTILIQYFNRKTAKFRAYTTQGKVNVFVLNHALENRNKANNSYYVTIPFKNPITGKPIKLRSDGSSDLIFSRGRKEDFDVVIKGNYLYSVWNSTINEGYFKLKKG